MKRLLRKVLVIIVLLASLLTNTDCKKQIKCGCGKDVVRTFYHEAYVYFSSESPIITMQVAGDFYSSYSFCNPEEIRPKLANFKSGDVLVVSGDLYLDCNYVWQSSNYSYSSLYRSYNIHVTDIYVDLYGKDNPDEEVRKGF